MMSEQPKNLNALDYKGFFRRAKGFYNTLLKVYFLYLGINGMVWVRNSLIVTCAMLQSSYYAPPETCFPRIKDRF